MHIAKDPLNSRPMRSTRLMKILAHLVDDKGQIRTSHSEILKTTNDTAIASSLLRRKSITINTAQALRGCHRSGSMTAFKHASPRQELNSVLALSKKKASG
jgi:hypothetical protein